MPSGQELQTFEEAELAVGKRVHVHWPHEDPPTWFKGVLDKVENRRRSGVCVHVSYDDNAQALTLLEGPGGVISMLEEQCMLGERASDGGFVRSLSQRQGAHPRFSTPRLSSGKCSRRRAVSRATT